MFIFLLLFLLAGCGGGSYGPRTPIGGIGQGSTKPYYVRGSWHYPQSHYSYDETGIASWYGPGFHGKPKPYGEAFDMNGLSAAHRTLPLPSVVRVTNISNGKTIKIVVDDRGPFVYEGRIIDLSVGAAKALETYSKGLVTVRVQCVPGESRALSDYLAAHGNKSGKMRDGRTWQQVYRDEISGRYNDYESYHIPPRLSEAKDKNIEPKKVQKDVDILDDIINQTIDQSTAHKAATPKLAIKDSYIVLGKMFMQKSNADKLCASLPSSWCAKAYKMHSSGQEFYDVKIGPISDINALNTLLKSCKEKGFLHATSVKD